MATPPNVQTAESLLAVLCARAPELDTDIAALCAYAPSLALACECSGFTFEQGMAMFMEASRQQRAAADRVNTGYMPKAQRTAVAHLRYCEGIEVPNRKRVNDDAGQKARARVWGHAC